MVSEQQQIPDLNKSILLEPKLTIQSFHQCSSLISLKLDSTNFLMWRSQIVPLIRSLGIYHHIASDIKPDMEIITSGDQKIVNPNYGPWASNDGLLTTWLLGTMTVDILSFTFGLDSAFLIWKTIEEQLLPSTKEKEIFLNDSLMNLKKGNYSINEFLQKFNFVCDNLAAIGKPIGDLDKCFHLARALGPKYQDFRLAMLSKAPYPPYSQFVLALRGHEQNLLNQIEEKHHHMDHNQAFIGQRGRGRNNRGGRFSSRGRGFGPVGRPSPQALMRLKT